MIKKFTVLPAEEYDETFNEFPNIPLYLYFHKISLLPINYQKWQKQLSLYPTISFLDVKGTSFYLQVELNITDTH